MDWFKQLRQVLLPAKPGGAAIVVRGADMPDDGGMPDHDGPRVRWRDGTVSVACPGCARSLVLADTDGQALSLLEQAFVINERLSLDRRFKLTCPHCTTKWLAQVPAEGCLERETRVGNEWARDLIIKHIARMETDWPSSLTTREPFRCLTRPDVIDFVLQTNQHQRTDGSIGYRAQAFGRLYMAVSVVPVIQPRHVQEMLPGGYMALLEELMHLSGVAAGEADLAHWLLCRDKRAGAVVHLCYLPASKEAMAVLPWDLLSSDEQRDVFKIS